MAYRQANGGEAKHHQNGSPAMGEGEAEVMVVIGEVEGEADGSSRHVACEAASNTPRARNN